MEKKQAYEKPALRKVRLEVKTSVLASCHSSVVTSPQTAPVPCKLNNICATTPG